MSRKIRTNNIFYNDNNWRSIKDKYNLQSSLEVIIKEGQHEETSTGTTNKWLPRLFLITGIFALIGNIPVQSHLMNQSPLSSHVFDFDTTNIISDRVTPIYLNSTTPSQEIANDSLNKAIEDDALVTDVTEPQELHLPKRALETYVGHTAKITASKWKTYRVKSYDNLTNIFYKLGHQNILSTLKKDEAITNELSKLIKGTIVRTSSNDKGELSELVFTSDNINSYVLRQTDDKKYKGSWKQGIFEVRQSRSSFTIRNGLFFDGKRSGIDNSIIKQVVKVFDWDIDFSHDVRVGDKVTAVFEEIYHDGDKVGHQNLLAAEFINKGREFRAVRYTYADGKSDYFTPEGREMKKAFIRTPISHARVSSHFNPGRFHPVLHKLRAHKGTDFSARTGTPIMATGNGVITSLGRKGGYGRTIVIKHREGYTTLYAHMSRYNKKLKLGSKVYQGDLIGYVGSSGQATGSHLHYEFRKNGKAIDPMRASLPNSMSLSSRELQDFRNKAINLVLQLNVLNRFVKAKITINSAFGG